MELHAKCVELFRDALPGIRRVAALGNSADRFSQPFLEEVRLVGKTTGIDTPDFMVRTTDQIDDALAAMKKDGVEAVAKFELVINVKTAKALDLKIAESFLLRATTIIE